jgi:hypothetical protein
LIYVSLPVHTQPLVIAGQIRNFELFFPEALVVLHVSAEARFTMPELDAALRAMQCRNVLINPQRNSTTWGGILSAHLANIGWIRATGNAARICLHSSNDMLVRPGLARRLEAGGNFVNRRLIRPGSYWRFASAALADPALQAMCRRLGGTPVIGSQIEGSSYEAALLFEIADIISAVPDAIRPIGYPREEVWLSTLAHGLAARITGNPYIFSEIHRFDRVFWQVLRHIDPLIGKPGDAHHFPRRLIEFLMIKTGFHRINRTWVDRVARDAALQLAPYELMSDGNNQWRVFDRHGLFGVKRVPRRPGSALRTYIDTLAQSAPNQT